MIEKFKNDVDKLASYIHTMCLQTDCKHCIFGIDVGVNNKAVTCGLLSTPSLIKYNGEIDNSFGKLLESIMFICKAHRCFDCGYCDTLEDICYISHAFCEATAIIVDVNK